MIYNSAVHVSQPTHLVRTCQPLEVLSEPSRRVIHGTEAQSLHGRVFHRPSASHRLTIRRSDASERSSDSRHALPAMRRQPETSCNLMVAIGSVGKLWHAAAARSASRASRERNGAACVGQKSRTGRSAGSGRTGVSALERNSLGIFKNYR